MIDAITKKLQELGFDDRQIKTIKDAMNYALDPYGDVGHNLKVIVSKLAHIVLDENSSAAPGDQP